MRIQKHTENEARRLARRRFKNTFVQIVAHGGHKDAASGEYKPVRPDAPVSFFIETDEHAAEVINQIWETVVFSGHGREA